jgi:flagellar basal-body rod protein FlgB
MSETESIIELINAGIKAQTLRQKAVANNIANLETPGYRRIGVKFEELLAKCLRSNEDFDLSDIEAELYRPKNTPVKSNGNDVNLEAEIGQMIKDTLRYKAYIRLLGKKYSQIDQAINFK